MFRLSERDQDKNINKLIGQDDTVGITELEDQLYKLEAEKFGEASQKFGALAQDTLKLTLEEVKKAQAKEAETALYSGFQGISELTNINEEIANSILGTQVWAVSMRLVRRRSPEPRQAGDHDQ